MTKSLQTKSLQQLIDIANEAYCNGMLHYGHTQNSHNQIGDGTGRDPKEILAAYIVAEIRELYSPDSTDVQNVQRIVTGLEFALDELNAVMRQLRKSV